MMNREGDMDEFRKAVESASVADIELHASPIQGHPGKAVKCTVYDVVRVRGVLYSIITSSEESARAVVLQESREWLSATSRNDRPTISLGRI